MRSISLLLLISFVMRAQTPSPKLQPVGFSEVTITDSFWKPAMDKVATTTIQACTAARIPCKSGCRERSKT